MFWEGFEKRAESSLIGVMKGLRSGLRKYEKGGKIKTPIKAAPGVFIAPRSKTPPLPTYMQHNAKYNNSATLPRPKDLRKDIWRST